MTEGYRDGILLCELILGALQFLEQIPRSFDPGQLEGAEFDDDGSPKNAAAEIASLLDLVRDDVSEARGRYEKTMERFRKLSTES